MANATATLPPQVGIMVPNLSDQAIQALSDILYESTFRIFRAASSARKGAVPLCKGLGGWRAMVCR